MSYALQSALAAIFANKIMARDAIIYKGGAGPGMQVRIIQKMPDDITNFSAARVWSETMLVDILVKDVPWLAVGDKIEIDGDSYVIQGEPMRDIERMIWTAELVPE